MNSEGKKMLKYHLETQISVKDICDKSDYFYIEYFAKRDDDEKLFLGIPLLVSDGGKYYPVFGKKYINSSIQEQHPLQYSFVAEKSGTPCELFNGLILLTQEMKGFNIIERAHALRKLYDIDEKVDNTILKVLGIPNNERYLRGYLTLATASDKIKELVLHKRINEITAFEIFQFDRNDWEIVAGFIADIKLGTKKRNEVVNMIYDVMRRDRMRVEEIVESDAVREILTLKMDRLHIGQRLYSYFETVCHPYISQYKKRFYDKLREVGIERYFRLKIPQNFEDWKFDITFTFSSVDDFKKKVEILDEIGSRQSFQELMSLR
ncbi:MAG: hypothetical protein JSV25_03615 [Spirochaetota bacterium]|nr:MAG: hypothetical protein JSV25_03615 [Spirochaetota bacterium]